MPSYLGLMHIMRLRLGLMMTTSKLKDHDTHIILTAIHFGVFD